MRLAVLGSPIAHSLSPTIHSAAYRELGLPWVYERFELKAADLAAFLESRDADWLGFSLTMPLKEKAFEIAFELDHWAARSGVVNTLVRAEGGWRGFNTDVPGLAAALNDNDFDLSRTLVLGSGATAESAVLAAGILKADHITIAARNLDRAASLASKHQIEATTFSQLEGYIPTAVISTLPPEVGDRVELPESVLQTKLFDVAYNPWPSSLAKRFAAESDASVPVSGIHMLINQALLQIRIFVNGSPDIELPGEDGVLAALRDAVI